MEHTYTSLNNKLTLIVSDNYGCNNEEYLNDEYLLSADSTYKYANNDFGHCVYSNVRRANKNISTNGGRCAFFVKNTSGSFGISWSASSNNVNAPQLYGGSKATSSSSIPSVNQSWLSISQLYPHDYWSYSGSYVSGVFNFASNIPIFETQSQATEYVTNGTGLKNALNYKPDETSPNGDKFEITNCWTHGIWLNDTQPQVTRVDYRNFRGKMTDGTFALYPISGIDDGKLKMGIKNNATFVDMEYSTNGLDWYATDEFPFEYFYRKRTNELGEFDYALTFGNTRIPEFEDETTAQDYIDGNIDISEATNWGEISSSYPTHNGTGNEEDATTFGEVFTRNVFSQLYLCDTGGLYEISNALFDFDVTTLQGAWNDIKKGLEMYGTDPMQVVQGLRYYPFDLSTIFTNVSSQQYIYFGAYQLTMQSSVKKVIYCNGSIDLGSIYLKRTFNDWRDFEPYTKLSIYLPYVGSFPLDAKKYYNKTIDIKYFIDLRTGACTACLIADDVLLDWFDGIIGTEMPITLTDYASYAQSQLNIIMRNAGIGIAAEGMTGNIAAKGMKAAMGYNENANAVQDAALAGDPLKSSLSAQTAGSYGKQAMIAAGVGGAALLGTVAVGTGMKTAFDMMRTGTAAHTKTRPASSAMINQYLPQYAYFRFEILEIDESPYLNALYGRPTNESGLIMNFDGYLECEDVSLICPIATDNERQEIIDLLKAGIYITPP